MTSDDEALATRCRSLRDYGQSRKYFHDELGMNSRLDELHAAVLRTAFLPRLSGWTERRRQVAAAYGAGIRRGRVTTIQGPAGSESVWHLYPVLVPGGEREAFVRHLADRGVRTGIHYPMLIPHQKALARVPFEVRGPLRRAEEFAAGEVSLPIHPYLSDAEVRRVVETVDGWSAT